MNVITLVIELSRLYIHTQYLYLLVIEIKAENLNRRKESREELYNREQLRMMQI